MLILYAGLPSGALCLRARGMRIAAALVADRDRTGVRALRRALAADAAPLFVDPDLEDEDVLRVLASARADALVSFFWPRRIPAPALALAPVALGVHPSLLPRHRGADPIFWTIASGDPRTGVSVHDLAPEIDRGGVRLEVETDVAPDATGGSLWRALRREALDALARVLAAFDSGSAPPARPQSEVGASDAPLPRDADLEIRWDRPADEILRLVRAASPDPGAFTALADRTLTVLAAAPTSRRLDPGDAVLLPEGVCVGTATTAIRLALVEIGGERFRDAAIAGALPGLSQP
jgi:methionyl-tRNA formyltransferase